MAGRTDGRQSAGETRRPVILFFPHYYYLQYEGFLLVMRELQKLECDARMVLMHSKSFDESAAFTTERLKNEGCPLRVFRPLRLRWRPQWLVTRILQGAGVAVDSLRMRGFLRRERPDIVVVGSDLGGAYIRLVLDVSRRQGIPSLILSAVDYGLAASDQERGAGAAFPRAIQAISRLLGLSRILFFEGDVLGSYATNSKVLVPSRAARNGLVKEGIAEERITVVGNPARDRTAELRKQPKGEVKARVLHALGWEGGSLLVVYCTEVIHYVYGLPYLERVNALLLKKLEGLPVEVRVVVKLHPRESEESQAEFRTTFRGERFRVVRDQDLLPLLRAADLVVGHFSSVLLDGMRLDTPILSLNLRGDQRRELLGPDMKLLTIRREADLHKIRDVLYCADFREACQRSAADWLRENGAVSGEGIAPRIASLIKAAALTTHV